MERKRIPQAPYFTGRKTGRKDLFHSGVRAHPLRYENVAYCNFETNPKLNETFEENISPDYLIPILSHIAGQTIVKEKTLIVFDEVQLCERALTSLKYFCEDAPDYHIIVAGSLLGVAVNRAKFSFLRGKRISLCPPQHPAGCLRR